MHFFKNFPMKKKSKKFQFLLDPPPPDIIDMNMHRCYYSYSTIYQFLYYYEI